MRLVTLGEISTSIDYGITASANTQPVGPKFLRITDIQDGVVDWSLVPFCVSDKKKLIEARLQAGDIVFARTGATTGKSFLIRECPDNAVFASYLIKVRPGPQVNSSFLAHFFDSKEYWRQISLKSASVAQPGVNSSKLKELVVPLPPIEDQKRIAAILDQADSLRRLRQRAIDRLNSLGQAIFYEMFGDQTVTSVSWPIVKLGDVVRPGDKINYGVVQPGDDVESGVPLVRVGDLFADHIDPKTLKQIDPTIEKNYKRSRLVGDEILIGCVGSIGSVAVAHPGLQGANIARAVARIPVDQSVAVRDFVVEQIRSPFVQRYFHAETRTVAQPTLNIGLITSAPIILPPIAEQEKFSQIMAAARAIHKKFISHANIEATLFSSLQHRAFRGEL